MIEATWMPKKPINPEHWFDVAPSVEDTEDSKLTTTHEVMKNAQGIPCCATGE